MVGDDRKGAALAVEHLYELGHRDIAHLDGGTVPGGATAVRAGYVEAMRKRGLERHVRTAGGGFTHAHGADGVDELLRKRRPPTAIFAVNDLVALGAMQRLAELELSTPGDVSIVGYDNSSIAAQRRVGLTSIDQPRFEIGTLATALLHERLVGRQQSSRRLVAPKLVERERRGRSTITTGGGATVDHPVSAAVEAPFQYRDELAEMPYWDAARRRLCYVDINRGTINELDVATGDRHMTQLSVPLGFAMPVAASGIRLCGEGNDLIAVDEAGEELGRLPIEAGRDGNRMNEGKPDPHGRLWFGTMSKTREGPSRRRSTGSARTA